MELCYKPLHTAEGSMYVCLCNALTDRDLHPHTAAGTSSVSMVYQACGCRPQCGKCVPFVRQMLREGGATATSVVASDPG
jgi:bacterioferritin-associated ferredoxin